MWRTIGQSKNLALLQSSLQAGNLAHAYLFAGPPHVGKTTLALDLAQTLNCLEVDPPCGECQSCRKIIDGKHADAEIIGLNLNSSKNPTENKSQVEISIEEIRGLQRRASLPPYEGKHKVFIIDGAEYLSSEAANCLLKTLEEPSPGIILILLTSEEKRLLPTVVSRCQRLELKPIPSQEVEKILTDSGDMDSHRANLLARLSQGCLGWALTVSTNNSYLEKRAQKLSELYPLLKADYDKRFTYADQLGNDRKTIEEVIKFWLTWWHDVMLVKCDCKHAVINIDSISPLEEWALELNLLEIKRFIDRLQESLNQIAKNANPRLVFEVLILDMPRKEGKSGHAIVSMPGTL